MKVLIVEDDDYNSDMLSRRLSFRGFDVVTAADGPSGITAAIEQAPDVVLMDVALGAMNGWEATLALKADARTAAIPVIALTAHALSSDRAKSLEVGCAAFLAKPVDIERLLAKMNECARGSSEPQTAN